MTIYAEYTPEEQDVLRAGIQAAAVAISAASPGRKEETVSEGYAAAEFIMESGPRYVANTLVTSILAELQRRLKSEQVFPDYVKVASAPGAGEQAMANLRAVAALLDTKATAEEAAGFKGWLLDISQVVAKAGKEDQGFLGMGGVEVNDAERVALAAIAQALGVET